MKEDNRSMLQTHPAGISSAGASKSADCALTDDSRVAAISAPGNVPYSGEKFDFTKPLVVLAPMEGVTDAPMREFLTSIGGYAFCVAEFLRISRDLLPAKVYRKHLPELARERCTTASGVPVALQLLGGDASLMAESAYRAVTLGVRAIDINFGCPAPTVNRHDGGAVLLKCPQRIEQIVREVRQAVPQEIPVSAKLRLGWESRDDIFVNAASAAAGGADWLTIHGRTRVAGYSPPAYWENIGRVREQLSIPVIANGDLWSLDDVKRCYETSGSIHFMLGRSALADPWLARQILAWLGAEGRHADATDLYGLGEREFKEFTAISMRYGSEPVAIGRRIKQWVSLATRRRPIPWFDTIKRMKTSDEILASFASGAIVQ